MTLGFGQKCFGLQTVAAVVIIANCLSACDSKRAEAPPPRGDSFGSWAYPLRLGDSRAKAHEFLGNPTRATEVLEEYPMSGVTLWFSPEGRLTKLNFHGSAGGLYSMGGENWIPSGRSLVFGLTAHAHDLDFTRVLGAPVSEHEAGSANRRELRRIWRRDGYLIDGLFLASDRTEGGITFSKGSLLWLEVSPGL